MPDRLAGPLSALSQRRRHAAIALLLAAEAGQLAAFIRLERRMKDTGGPGIIGFELAGSTSRAHQITDTWGAAGCAAARQSLRLDFLFPATYAPLHAIVCDIAGDAFVGRGRQRLAEAAGPLAWGQLAAAGFDYVENTALLFVLAGRDRHAPVLARRAAMVKFALIYAGWTYIALAALDLGLIRARLMPPRAVPRPRARMRERRRLRRDR